MSDYSEVCLKTFLKDQGKLFDEPVAGNIEEAEAFLEDCMAVVVDSIDEVREYFEEEGVDVDGLAAYITEYFDWAESVGEEGEMPFDVTALLERYKEGCTAYDSFKEALTVEKAEKGTYTVDGTEVSCQGYSVQVSKAAMIDFLRTSSDFFLQDET